MKEINRILCTLLAVFFLTTGYAQQPRYYKDIQRFKSLDSAQFPPKKALLFIGSSSFTIWKDVQEYFPEHQIINRGFGGSTLPDLIRYVEDIVYPYNPKQVVIYCGENDLAASDTVNARTVAERFKTLFSLIRERYPKVPVLYVSMKPSPSRERLMQKMDAGNWAIESFLKQQKKADYLDVYHLMLDSDGRPREELFLKDMLHMNKEGYVIWQAALKPLLK